MAQSLVAVWYMSVQDMMEGLVTAILWVMVTGSARAVEVVFLTGSERAVEVVMVTGSARAVEVVTVTVVEVVVLVIEEGLDVLHAVVSLCGGGSHERRLVSCPV